MTRRKTAWAVLYLAIILLPVMVGEFAARLAAMGKAKYPQGADLVIEVVSEGDEARKRDYEAKRAIYAEYRVAEYWIVDPGQKQITVLCLDETSKAYREHAVCQTGQQATSVLLHGLSAAVDDVFSQPLT